MIRRKRNKPAPHDLRQTASKPLLPGFLIPAVLALLLGGIPFGLGKYIEFNSPGPFDSGAYVYSAQHLLDGARLGVDERSSARPNTLLANIIGVKLFGFNDTGPKIVQMFLQLAAMILMFITLRKVFGPVAAVIGTTIASVYLSAPLIAKFGNAKEQFMIAFMIGSACSFVWYKYTHKRYWLVLSGFFALQPYYFKPTGMSIVFAIILYTVTSRIISRRFKTLWIELAMFLCGYTLGLVIPGSLYIWQGAVLQLLRSFPPAVGAMGAGVLMLAAILIGLPVLATQKGIPAFKKIPPWTWSIGFIVVLLILAVSQQNRILAAAGLKGGGYLADSVSVRGFSELAPQVFRYYKALSVPILTALCSIIAAATVWIRKRIKKTRSEDIPSQIVWVLAIWWILDIGFVWISPRSYEQYYLPLCGSAAMLSGYVIWIWQTRFSLSIHKLPWLAGGMAAVIVLGGLSIPIFIGQRYSPDTGADYLKTQGARQRGFGPALKELPFRQKGAWIAAGDYIRTHSSKQDTIYVWGWYPGIYVKAQRMAPIAKAYESDMHITPPDALHAMVLSMVKQFQQAPPKFIVDSRKTHFPNDRPPLELWPHKFAANNPNGGEPIPNDPRIINQYDKMYKRLLAEKFDPRQEEYNILLTTMAWPGLRPWNKAMPDEAERYEAMKPFREFVMNNYRIAGQYGIHIVFERIKMPQEQSQ